MPEHLRALVYILAIATVVFLFARVPATATAIAPDDFRRRRNLWFAVTLLAFLAHDFWIFILVAGTLLLLNGQREQHPLSLYVFLLAAVPEFYKFIGGLGLVNQLFPINFARTLALTVLLPAFLYQVSRPDRLRLGSLWTDRFLLAFLAVDFGVSLYYTSFTNVLRHGVFLAFVDIFLPYYVASRSLKNLAGFRDVAMTIVVATLLLSALAVFEYVRTWSMYMPLQAALGYPSGAAGGYLGRAGALRAAVTTSQPIVMGFLAAVALGFMLYVRTLLPSALARRVLVAVLIGGLYSSISRGPWVGAVVMLFVFIATGPGGVRKVATYGVAGAVGIVVMSFIPGLSRFVELLPYIGRHDAGSVDYRENLVDAAFEVIWKSPWFGGVDIFSASNAADLIWMEGFIDVVNSYIGIMLRSGFVGLALFVGVFASAAIAVWQGFRVSPGTDETEERVLGRALFAILVGIAFTIYTVSSINFIPLTYWYVLGMAVAYSHMQASTQRGKVRARGEASSHVGAVSSAGFRPWAK